jgi:hypothetical protein
MNTAAKEPFLGPAEILFLAVPGVIICLVIIAVMLGAWLLG